MPKIRWLMIWLCFLANAIGYIDRANLAIAAPMIRAELGIDAAAMGLVLSAFFWTYALMQLPAGWFIDKVGVRVALVLAVGWWSLFTAATGAARGVAQFVAARLMLGAGEASSQPSFAKVAYNWFPRSERGLACSVFNSGSTAGSALSLPLVTLLIAAVGWRGSFVATGLLGLVVYLSRSRTVAVGGAPAGGPSAGAARTAVAGHGGHFLVRPVSLPLRLGADDRAVLPEFRDLFLHHLVSKLPAAGARLFIGRAGYPGITARADGRGGQLDGRLHV
jgi:ACS family D-galactonate transporter-like MFS transporter